MDQRAREKQEGGRQLCYKLSKKLFSNQRCEQMKFHPGMVKFTTRALRKSLGGRSKDTGFRTQIGPLTRNTMKGIGAI